MPFLHVVVELKGTPNSPVLLFQDLSTKDLRRRFVIPYERGNALLGEQIVSAEEVRKVTIVETNLQCEAELGKLRQKHEGTRAIRVGGRRVLIAGVGVGLEDIVQCGRDVTVKVTLRAPGSRGRRPLFLRVLTSIWTTVGASVALAGALYYLGWK